MTLREVFFWNRCLATGELKENNSISDAYSKANIFKTGPNEKYRVIRLTKLWSFLIGAADIDGFRLCEINIFFAFLNSGRRHVANRKFRPLISYVRANYHIDSSLVLHDLPLSFSCLSNYFSTYNVGNTNQNLISYFYIIFLINIIFPV